MRSLREAIKLFWTFRVPWGWTYTAGTVADWVAQFSFGFYSLMLTSLLLGLIVMVFYKPRTWCAFCPMGTMTQGRSNRSNQICLEHHVAKHRQEKDQKAITESLGGQVFSHTPQATRRVLSMAASFSDSIAFLP